MAKKLVFYMLFLALLSACSPSSAAPPTGYVDLNNLQPLPTNADQKEQPLRVAIAAVISPQGSAESYALLLNYLGDKLNRPVERIQRRTYAEVNDLLRTGEVDIAFVCTSSYLLGKDEFGLKLLAAPKVNGKTTYQAKVIVRADSKFQKFEDLRGAHFAFTDPTSFTGRVYPTYLLKEMGEKPQTFFSSTTFTYSHDTAIQAVVDGTADAASIDSLVLDFALKRDPNLATQIRVIHTSPDFGIPPVVISPTTRPQLEAQLEEILLGMHLNPAGQAALAALDYDRFVLVNDEDYQTAKEIETQVTLDLVNP